MKKIYLSKNSLTDDELSKMIDDLEKQGFEVILSPYNQLPDQDEKVNEAELNASIKECDLVLVLIDGNCDEDVDRETETAVFCGKRAVGVYTSGATEDDVPKSLKKIGSGLINWDLDKIYRAVNGDETGWYSLAGKPGSDNTRVDSSEC